MSYLGTTLHAVHTHNPSLAEAIGDAQLLLAFAAKNGKKLDHDLVRVIVASGKKTEISEEEEANFWEKFSELAAILAPTSAESIKTMGHAPSQISPAWWDIWKWLKLWFFKDMSDVQKTVFRYTVTAVSTLIVLVSIQAFWAFGSLLISDIKVKQGQIKEIEIKMLANKELSKGGAKTSPNTNSEDGIEEYYEEGASQEKILGTEKENLLTYLKSNYLWLERWSYLPERVLNLAAENKIDNKYRQKPIDTNVARLQSSTIVLDILRQYVLPLIYGLLGTCVYILRDLSYKIKACAFTPTATINFHIRMCLGPLGGIAVAWFITPATGAESLASLSPLALAFLAGYSVELLFAAMDTVISAFTGKRQAVTAKE